MAKINIVDWNTITNFVIDSFVGYGIPREDALICADSLYGIYHDLLAYAQPQIPAAGTAFGRCHGNRFPYPFEKPY